MTATVVRSLAPTASLNVTRPRRSSARRCASRSGSAWLALWCFFLVQAFFVLLPMLKRTETISLDFDWIYRRFVPRFWKEVATPLLNQLKSARDAVIEWFPGRSMAEKELPPTLRRRMPGTWAVSVPVLVITLMLLAYLLIYFWLVPSPT